LFARHILAVIVRREGHVERLGFARLDTDNGILEIRQHASCPRNHGEILGLTALELGAIQRTDKIDTHLVVLLRSTVNLLEHSALFCAVFAMVSSTSDSLRPNVARVTLSPLMSPINHFRIDLEGWRYIRSEGRSSQSF